MTSLAIDAIPGDETITEVVELPNELAIFQISGQDTVETQRIDNDIKDNWMNPN